MFHVGQHVVCIFDAQKFNPHIITRPKKGDVCTIRGIVEHPIDGIGLLFEEHVNPTITQQWRHVGYRAWEVPFKTYRFRPLKKLSVGDFCSNLEEIKA